MDPLQMTGVHDTNFIPTTLKKDHISGELANDYKKTHSFVSNKEGRSHLNIDDEPMDNKEVSFVNSDEKKSAESISFKEPAELKELNGVESETDEEINLFDFGELDADADELDAKILDEKIENIEVITEEKEVITEEKEVITEENEVITENIEILASSTLTEERAGASIELASEEKSNASSKVAEGNIEQKESGSIQSLALDKLNIQKAKLGNVNVFRGSNLIQAIKAGNFEKITNETDPDLTKKFKLTINENTRKGELALSQEQALEHGLKPGDSFFDDNGIEITVRYETLEEKRQFKEDWEAYKVAVHNYNVLKQPETKKENEESDKYGNQAKTKEEAPTIHVGKDEDANEKQTRRIFETQKKENGTFGSRNLLTQQAHINNKSTEKRRKTLKKEDVKADVIIEHVVKLLKRSRQSDDLAHYLLNSKEIDNLSIGVDLTKRRRVILSTKF